MVIREFTGLDSETIRRDVLPEEQPAVLRGLVRDWPAGNRGPDLLRRVNERRIFEQYVFGDDAEATAHIPAQRRGILGPLSAEQLAGLRAHLAKRLTRR